MKSAIEEVSQRLQGDFRIVDLTHTLVEGIPVPSDLAPYSHAQYSAHEPEEVFRHFVLGMSEHTGTHMDAPSHLVRRDETPRGIDEIPLSRLFGMAACIDMSRAPVGNLTEGQVREWEQENRPLDAVGIVLIRYGWDRLWRSGAKGMDFLEEWPGMDESAALYLVDRGIKLVGCDTSSVDPFSSTNPAVHMVLLNNDVGIVENLRNLDMLSILSLFLAFPLKIGGGTGSPVRAIAFATKSNEQTSTVR